jgi:hypothetical protein
MSACLKTNWTTEFLNLARKRMGSDFRSKAEFAAGLDDDPRGKAPEYRIRQVPALGPHWSRA